MTLFSRIGRIPAFLLVLAFAGMAVFIHAYSIRYPYIGMVLKHEGGEWRVDRVDPSGQAGEQQAAPGDKVSTIDGVPAPERLSGQEKTSLLRARSVVLERSDGSRHELVIRTEPVDLYQAAFSLVLEGVLIGFGVLAVRKNGASRLVRRFFVLNLVMAYAILTLNSTEMLLSDFILMIASIWLPYLLLSICMELVLRAPPPPASRLLAAYRVFCVGFSLYAVYAVTGDELPAFIRETVHLVFMFALLLIVSIVTLYWKKLGRVERNHALVLAAGVLLSLLPYVFLYAIPDLLGESYILSAEYSLIGLVPLSGTLLYVLGRRSLLDMQVYISRLLIHGVYFGSVFVLFWTARPLGPIYAFGLFVLLTYAYRRCLQWSARGAERRKEWLERQKLKLSIRLAEQQNVRDILRMLGEVVHSAIDVEGVCIVWRDGTQSLAQGTGIYENLDSLQEIQEANRLDPEELEKRFGFGCVVPFEQEEASAFGFLCIGPKRNASLFTMEERRLVDGIRLEALRLLSNARQLADLRKEYLRTQAQNVRFERDVSDIKKTNRILLEAQQSERIRTSHFLHDQILQNLIFLSRDLEDLADQGKVEAQRIGAWLRCVYDSQRDIRLFCDDLYPHIVDKSGLRESLLWLLRAVGERGALQTELICEQETLEPMDPIVKHNLFRIVRELTHNALKHAEATRLEIRLWKEPGGGIRCAVKDNGRGFDPAALHLREDGKEPAHLGLVSVSSQIGYLGGEWELRSAPGKGTEIAIRLPAREGEMERWSLA